MAERVAFDESERFPQPGSNESATPAEQINLEEPSEIDTKLEAMLRLYAYKEAVDDASQKLIRAKDNFLDTLELAGHLLTAPDNFCFSMTKTNLSSGKPEGAPQIIYGWDKAGHKPNKDLQAGEVMTFSGDSVAVSNDDFRIYVVNHEDNICTEYTPANTLLIVPLQTSEEN